MIWWIIRLQPAIIELKSWRIQFNFNSKATQFESNSLESDLNPFRDVVELEEYAVILKRIKKSRHDIFKRAWIICDRERESRDLIDRQRRHTSSKHVDCSFRMTTWMKKNIRSSWFWELIMNYHIHEFTSISVYSIHQRMIISSARFDIIKQFVVQIASSQILSFLQYDDFNEEAAMISRRDIYNLVAQHCRDELSSLTFIQALVQELNDDDWIFVHQKNIKNQIIHFFFARCSSQKFLQKNFEMLMMNCTYKINCFKLSLLMIIDQTTLHFIFYIVFVFIKKKKMNDYIWIMQQMKILYESLNLSALVVVIIDMKRDLINEIFQIWFHSRTAHFLCTWHICKNIVINCKKQFSIVETWNKFFATWSQIMYVFSETEYRAAWNAMTDEYNLIHSHCIEYLWKTYLQHFRHRFVRCYTNQVTHFDIIVTSRDEEAHAVLKKQLNTSTDDLKTMMTSANPKTIENCLIS